MAGQVHEFDDANFEAEVLQRPEAVVVDFWAPWCGPCKLLAPVVEELAEQYAGRVRVGKLDADRSPKVAGSYGVQLLPTILVFKGGRVVESLLGLVDKSAIVAAIDRQLA